MSEKETLEKLQTIVSNQLGIEKEKVYLTMFVIYFGIFFYLKVVPVDLLKLFFLIWHRKVVKKLIFKKCAFYLLHRFRYY